MLTVHHLHAEQLAQVGLQDLDVLAFFADDDADARCGCGCAASLAGRSMMTFPTEA